MVVVLLFGDRFLLLRFSAFPRQGLLTVPQMNLLHRSDRDPPISFPWAQMFQLTEST